MPRKSPQPPAESAVRASVMAEVNNDTQNAAPPAAVPAESVKGVTTQTLSMAEPDAATASIQHWRDRALRAEVAQRELLRQFEERNLPLNREHVLYNGLLVLLHALIAEGRLSHEEATARWGEYQNVYLRSEYPHQLRQREQERHRLVEERRQRQQSQQAVASWRPNLRGKVQIKDPTRKPTED